MCHRSGHIYKLVTSGIRVLRKASLPTNLLLLLLLLLLPVPGLELEGGTMRRKSKSRGQESVILDIQCIGEWELWSHIIR